MAETKEYRSVIRLGAERVLVDTMENPIDIKRTLERYLTLNTRLINLNELRANYSRDFYRMHSIVGGMVGNDEAYNSALRPDTAAIKIITEEGILTKMIERLELRIKKFDEFLAEIDRKDLEAAFELKGISPIEQDAYEFTIEIEYYLTQHAIERVKRRNEQLIELGVVTMQEELNVNNRMGLYGSVEKVEYEVTQKLLGEVTSYETSLFEKLEELLA